MCETCDSCVSSCNNPHPPTTEWTHSESRQSHCERLRAPLALYDEKDLMKVWPGLQHLVPHTLRKKGRKWKELHPSVQAWVREMAGKLMWRRVSERTREAGNGEWALSFWGQGGKSKSRLHRRCLLLRSERWEGGGYGGVKGPPVCQSVCRHCAGRVFALRPLQTEGILFLSHCNNTGFINNDTFTIIQ